MINYVILNSITGRMPQMIGIENKLWEERMWMWVGIEEDFIKKLGLELDVKKQINLREMMKNQLGMNGIMFKG